jgi:integrase
MNMADAEDEGKSGQLSDPQPPLTCLRCGSKGPFDCAGHRYLKDGTDRQRWRCKRCHYRFSKRSLQDPLEPLKKLSDWRLKTRSDISEGRQVCVTLARGTKNLTTATETKTIAGEIDHSSVDQEVKGKILGLCFYMQKQAYSESTIRLNRIALTVLATRGANLEDQESVKETIAKQQWSENRKRNVINAYTLYLKIQGLTWEKPRCHVTRKFPFIPCEQELDALIAGSGKKLSTFLQLLKETAMRCGEAKSLEWTDIDFQKNIVTLNDPEKGSNPRLWKVSQKLMSMLDALPRESTFVFGDGPVHSMKTTYQKTRKRLAEKLQNPRLRRVSFHTFRHWKATMLQHQTHDPLYVRDFLGHKELRNTEIYINIERTLFEPSSDEFTVRITDKLEEIKTLLEVGFEYVCQKDNLIFLRKRK